MPSTLKPRPRSTCFPSPLPGSPSEGLGLSAMQGARCRQPPRMWLEGSTEQWIEVHNPATNQVVTKVPQSTQAEMENAVESAKSAGRTWSRSSPMARQQIMFKYQQLIKHHLDDIAKLITVEQGKTLPDAQGDVMRGLQVVEQACSVTNLLIGENLVGVSKDMDPTCHRTPLGVCAGIAPFNFPAMIPLWMF